MYLNFFFSILHSFVATQKKIYSKLNTKYSRSLLIYKQSCAIIVREILLVKNIYFCGSEWQKKFLKCTDYLIHTSRSKLLTNVTD